MSPRRIAVFFYGSYINLDVLAQVELRPASVESALLPGYEITIAPLANLHPEPGATAYGILVDATHAQLARLYAHARDVLGGEYLPEGVLVHTFSGRITAASCYVSHTMEPAPAASEYVNRILKPAQGYGFPGWYLERLASFKPRT